jgi:GNAT superfamily N-acetyltransferase
VELCAVTPADYSELFGAFARIVEAGEGFPHEPPLTWEQFDHDWLTHASSVVAARLGGGIAGAYYLKPNFAGRAAHIGNAGYFVLPEHRRRGIGTALIERSIAEARELGFDAIQFNLVFEANPARRLYERLGWRVTGRVPLAVDGEDALVYWRSV